MNELREQRTQEVDADWFGRLASVGERRWFPAGSLLMQQGEIGISMHVILAGRVRIERSHPQLLHPVVLAELGAGEIVGEMAALDGEPRSATVVAIEDTVTREIGTGELARLAREDPEVSAALLRILTKRLRNTDELVEEKLGSLRHDIAGRRPANGQLDRGEAE